MKDQKHDKNLKMEGRTSMCLSYLISCRKASQRRRGGSTNLAHEPVGTGKRQCEGGECSQRLGPSRRIACDDRPGGGFEFRVRRLGRTLDMRILGRMGMGRKWGCSPRRRRRTALQVYLINMHTADYRRHQQDVLTGNKPLRGDLTAAAPPDHHRAATATPQTAPGSRAQPSFVLN